MGAARHDPPGVEHEDPVGKMKGGKPMRSHECGPPLHDPAQPVMDGLLRPGIDGTRGVVEDEDARVGHDGPRQRDPLALAARENQPALAHQGVVPGG